MIQIQVQAKFREPTRVSIVATERASRDLRIMLSKIRHLLTKTAESFAAMGDADWVVESKGSTADSARIVSAVHAAAAHGGEVWLTLPASKDHVASAFALAARAVERSSRIDSASRETAMNMDAIASALCAAGSVYVTDDYRWNDDD